MKAFVTGSTAYGYPRFDSDVDLVVYMDEDTKTLLESYGGYIVKVGETGNFNDDYQCIHLRFGELDILPVTDMAVYEAWRVGTEKLIAERPVTRERAIEVLNECGVPQVRRMQSNDNATE